MTILRESYLGAPENPRTAAAVCYITIIGWFIAFALYRGNKTSLAAFHLRQSLLLYIVLIVANVAGIWATTGFVKVADAIWFLLWLWGFIDAVYEREKPVPLIGDMAQNIFGKL